MNQDGPSLIIEAPPPPPPGLHIAYIFYILLSFGVILRCLWGLEVYIYNVYEFC